MANGRSNEVFIVGTRLVGLPAGISAQRNCLLARIFEKRSASRGINVAWIKGQGSFEGGTHFLRGHHPGKPMHWFYEGCSFPPVSMWLPLMATWSLPMKQAVQGWRLEGISMPLGATSSSYHQRMPEGSRVSRQGHGRWPARTSGWAPCSMRRRILHVDDQFLECGAYNSASKVPKESYPARCPCLVDDHSFGSRLSRTAWAMDNEVGLFSQGTGSRNRGGVSNHIAAGS